MVEMDGSVGRTDHHNLSTVSSSQVEPLGAIRDAAVISTTALASFVFAPAGDQDQERQQSTSQETWTRRRGANPQPGPRPQSTTNIKATRPCHHHRPWRCHCGIHTVLQVTALVPLCRPVSRLSVCVSDLRWLLTWASLSLGRAPPRHNRCVNTVLGTVTSETTEPPFRPQCQIGLFVTSGRSRTGCLSSRRLHRPSARACASLLVMTSPDQGL